MVQKIGAIDIKYLEIESTPETLDKGDRPRLDVGSLAATYDGFVHIILPDRGTNDGMDLRRQLLGCGHPIPQRYRYRDDPLVCRYPGDHLLDEVSSSLGHAPPGTRGAKTASFTAESQQQLCVTGITAQPQETMREDATLQVVVQFALHIGGQTSVAGSVSSKARKSPDDRQPLGRAASGSDRVAHRRMAKPPEMVSRWFYVCSR